MKDDCRLIGFSEKRKIYEMFQDTSRFIDPLVKTSPARKQQAKFLNVLQTFLEALQQTKGNFRVFFE
ncbi:hypothetical protein P5673_000580 [Acropora cervicornis]|uniref:Uncharacterized protein n=1 Tax=Acropora cervicornis TaxID=6130 RepID=A0AAD9R780_ACRCE|nr:hypothetical protein P5673_000580 [Acropora cervicornis]